MSNAQEIDVQHGSSINVQVICWRTEISQVLDSEDVGMEIQAEILEDVDYEITSGTCDLRLFDAAAHGRSDDTPTNRLLTINCTCRDYNTVFTSNSGKGRLYVRGDNKVSFFDLSSRTHIQATKEHYRRFWT